MGNEKVYASFRNAENGRRDKLWRGKTVGKKYMHGHKSRMPEDQLAKTTYCTKEVQLACQVEKDHLLHDIGWKGGAIYKGRIR